jgi:hypothetical protein
MNRNRYNGRYYGNTNYNNYNNYYNYNYYNSDYGDRFPEVARLPYKFLRIISRRARSSINPAVYEPNENSRHFKINCHASFDCYTCSNFWTSNRITVELWWKRGKKQFDVRMYGQQCKRCNGEFIAPYLNGVDNIIDTCVEVLTNRYRGRGINNNKNTNTQFNSSHDERRCQKCRMIGHPCW